MQAQAPAPAASFSSAPRYSGSLRSKLERKQRQVEEDEQMVAVPNGGVTGNRNVSFSWDEADSISVGGSSGVTDFTGYSDAAAAGGFGSFPARATGPDVDGASLSSAGHSIVSHSKSDMSYQSGSHSPPQFRGEPSGEMAASTASIRQAQSDQLVQKLKLQLEQHVQQQQPEHDETQDLREERKKSRRQSSNGGGGGSSSSSRRRRRHRSCSSRSSGGSSVEEGGKGTSVAGSDHQHGHRRRERGSSRGSRSVDGGSSR